MSNNPQPLPDITKLDELLDNFRVVDGTRNARAPLSKGELKTAFAQLLLEANRDLLNKGIYAERVSYLHPDQDPTLNWPIITEPVYIVPASVVNDLAAMSRENTQNPANPPKPGNKK